MGWGLWNGLAGLVIVIVHVFGARERVPVYGSARPSNRYNADPVKKGGGYGIVESVIGVFVFSLRTGRATRSTTARSARSGSPSSGLTS